MAALVRASDGVLFSTFTGSDLSPATLAFNNVGLRLGTSAQATSVNINQCSVVARRTSYNGRTLVIPTGGEFVGSQAAGANLVVSSGSEFAASGNGVGSISVGSASFAGGGTWQLNLASDGSASQAGTGWDLLATSGAVDLSNATSGSPITIQLNTLGNGGTRGPLANWDPNVNHRWTGFATAAGGISGFSSQDFVIDASGFQNPIAGTFSIQQGADGKSLDLVYAVPTQVPSMPQWGLPLLAFLLLGLAMLRLGDQTERV